MKITREKIIQKLTEAFKEDPLVIAFWLDGADALNTVDRYSDIDIRIYVKRKTSPRVINRLRSILSEMGSLDTDLEIDIAHKYMRQIFYHFKNTSEFLILDVGIIDYVGKIEFIRDPSNPGAKIIFDKKNLLAFKRWEKNTFRKYLKKRLASFQENHAFAQTRIRKEVLRRNYLEALHYYHHHILYPLVELLRFKYYPIKHHFGLKHIKRDLPAKILLQMENLFKVNSLDDIKVKSEISNKLFQKLLGEIQKKF